MTISVYDKRRIRQLARQRRAQAAADLTPEQAKSIPLHLINWCRRLPALTLAAYAPIQDEPDITPALAVLEQWGWTIALPSIVGPDQPLDFKQWRVGTPLLTHPKYLTPEPDAKSEILSPSIVLLPLLAFDSSGVRLGFGGGFYDRTLNERRANGTLKAALGIAWDCQEITDLPCEAHDAPLDGVITETGVRMFLA